MPVNIPRRKREDENKKYLKTEGFKSTVQDLLPLSTSASVHTLTGESRTGKAERSSPLISSIQRFANVPSRPDLSIAVGSNLLKTVTGNSYQLAETPNEHSLQPLMQFYILLLTVL